MFDGGTSVGERNHEVRENPGRYDNLDNDNDKDKDKDKDKDDGAKEMR